MPIPKRYYEELQAKRQAEKEAQLAAAVPETNGRD